MKKFTYKKVYTLIIILIVLIVCVGISGSYMAVHRLEEETGTDESLNSTDENADLTVIGFSQPGAESAWRVALTESIKDTFTEEKGYKLIYKDGQSKQDNQIRDIRTFIQQGVDYIILSPIVETGWDQVFEEAKEAGIPMIICDRAVTVSNESLYTAFAGSNFREEGMTAVGCVEKILREKEKQNGNSFAVITASEDVTADDKGEIDADNAEETSDQEADINDFEETDGQSLPETESTDVENSGEDEDGDEAVENTEDTDQADAGESAEEDENNTDDGIDYFNIVHIQGTLGSSAQIGRTRALEDAVAEHSDWRIIAQVCGDFTKGKSREEMTNILDEIDGSQIDMIYCENDEEALGAMAALNEAGLSYGVGGKIMIVSFDGTKEALNMCMSGLINVEVECNPLQGDYIGTIVSHLQKGDKVPKIAYIDETYFTPDTLTPDFIESRVY